MNKNKNLRNQKLIIATRYHIIPLISRVEKLLTEEIIFLLDVCACVWMCMDVCGCVWMCRFFLTLYLIPEKIETEYILTILSILFSDAPLAHGRGNLLI